MLIIPAIDIKGGRCVRLRQGLMDEETVYSENPPEVALGWESKGAGLLHLVDLDAAVGGKTTNFSVIRDIASIVKIPVQIGGGIRDRAAAETYLSLANVKRIILGTAAYEDPGFTKRLCGEYPGRIAVGIDAKDGMAAIKGWLSVTKTPAITLAVSFENSGVACLIYTDISRDGMLSGPNVEAIKRFADAVNIPVIASGGVSSIEDIIAIGKTGAKGVIIGKALYSGAIDLEGAIARIRSLGLEGWIS
ncbi:MAG: 1-(5-phosphoribosyl)-5-[(5-phosphoribosylamino)methylideneamino]imidazole-4-carboxamide isomerase [Deltaproteobacteria bacterium]|nr:1-(5-phosphoribosyl)-5-[(5-phosphoribosylamino)methylideneamino]imidazole-4-carboxamide isomerase [Deltaproteobacteria bacterium]